MDLKWLLVVVALLLLAILLYKHLTRGFDYFLERKIPHLSNPLPYIGHVLSGLTLRENFAEFYDRVYKAHKNDSLVGFFHFQEPNLLVRDPQIAKAVLISQFTSFHENALKVDSKLDPLAARNPFFAEPHEWKTQRARLTVALMSSRKLKVLFGSVINVCEKFANHLRRITSESPGSSFETETRELFSSFTGEVVASAGFGVEGDFFDPGQGESSFRESVTGAFEPTTFNILKHNLLFRFPTVNRILGGSFIPPRTDHFFRRVVNQITTSRRRDGTTGHDVLQILMDTQKLKGEEVISEQDLTTSATSFFMDGYETSSITMGFFAYQIAAHPEVQEKLREELLRVLEKHEGRISYEAVMEMTYMDQALFESMRLDPATLVIAKKCTEECEVVGSDGKAVKIEPGTVMVIPSYSFHMDPEYWESPELFDPDRFTEENKKKRPKTVFLPFGEGPRICVGMRFAILQIKAAMATILRDYRIGLSSKTRVPLVFKPTQLLTAVEGGLWIILEALEKRTEN